VDIIFAFLPFSATHSQGSFDAWLVQVLISIRHVVAKRRVFTLCSDIVHIEFRIQGITYDDLSQDLACFQCHQVQAHANHFLTNEVASLKEVVLSGSNEVIFVSEISVFWVLLIGVNPTISNGNSLEIHSQISHVIQEVVSNGWHVVTSITFSGYIEIPVLVLWILSQETLQE